MRKFLTALTALTLVGGVLLGAPARTLAVGESDSAVYWISTASVGAGTSCASPTHQYDWANENKRFNDLLDLILEDVDAKNYASVTIAICDADNGAAQVYEMDFDTDPTDTIYYNNNPLDSENSRLSVSGVLSSGSSAFNSALSLSSTNTDELQYIFGRIIFPQTNFTLFSPVINTSSSVNYSALSGSNKTYNVYTNINNPGATTPVTFTDYRWHVTSYGAVATYLDAIPNGIFTFTSGTTNFTEADLAYSATTGSSGTNDLVILVGIDSSGLSTTPDKFLYVSGDPVTYITRQSPGSQSLDINGQIKFSVGTLPTAQKVWLFIGYKNSTRGKNLYMSNIHLTV
jgi:hypothetical protein